MDVIQRQRSEQQSWKKLLLQSVIPYNEWRQRVGGDEGGGGVSYLDHTVLNTVPSYIELVRKRSRCSFALGLFIVENATWLT